MSKTLDKLLALAESQTGYTEKNNDKDLDAAVGPTAGNGNHTKYARDLTAMGLPGYCGAAWCAVYQMRLKRSVRSSITASQSGIMPKPQADGWRPEQLLSPDTA